MNETTKQHCLEVLRKPKDEKRMTALVDAFGIENPEMADHLKLFLETGQSRPYGNVWATDGLDESKTVYVIVRIAPKPIGVLFACACAREVLPYLEKSHSGERCPIQLIELVEAWVTRATTKREIKQKYEAFSEFASQIDWKWHAMLGSGQLDSLRPDEIRNFEIPLFAVDVIGYAAQSVGFKKDSISWLTSIDLTARTHLEFFRVVSGTRGVSSAKQRQLKQLERLILASEAS